MAAASHGVGGQQGVSSRGERGWVGAGAGRRNTALLGGGGVGGRGVGGGCLEGLGKTKVMSERSGGGA